jgi:hypothetical protein
MLTREAGFRATSGNQQNERSFRGLGHAASVQLSVHYDAHSPTRA